MPSMSSSPASRTWSSRLRPPGFTNPSLWHARRVRMTRRGISVLAVAALVVIGGIAGAQAQQCDFATGGGYIVNNDAKANFGVGGSCKRGGDDHGLWGHLEYIDHGTSLNVHW